jgi:hypothetical protein
MVKRTAAWLRVRSVNSRQQVSASSRCPNGPNTDSVPQPVEGQRFVFSADNPIPASCCRQRIRRVEHLFILQLTLNLWITLLPPNAGCFRTGMFRWNPPWQSLTRPRLTPRRSPDRNSRAADCAQAPVKQGMQLSGLIQQMHQWGSCTSRARLGAWSWRVSELEGILATVIIDCRS